MADPATPVPKRWDLTGQRFGKLVVLGLDEDMTGTGNERWWRVQCDCGTTRSLPRGRLTPKSGYRSCGCARRKDHSGETKPNGSTLLRRVENSSAGARYDATCPCGKTWAVRYDTWKYKDAPTCPACSYRAAGEARRGKPGTSRKGVVHLSQRKNFEPGTVVGKWTLTGEHKTDPKSRQLRWHAFCECGRDAWPLGASLRAALDPTLKGRPSRSCGRCSTPPEVPFSYSGAHGHVRAKRGPASEHKCVDCGRQAHDWSYSHNDLAEIVGPERPDGTDMLYSARPDNYVPRCRRCHRLFDDLMERVRSRKVPPSNAPELFATLVGNLPPLSSHEIVRLD